MILLINRFILFVCFLFVKDNFCIRAYKNIQIFELLLESFFAYIISLLSKFSLDLLNNFHFIL